MRYPFQSQGSGTCLKCADHRIHFAEPSLKNKHLCCEIPHPIASNGMLQALFTSLLFSYYNTIQVFQAKQEFMQMQVQFAVKPVISPKASGVRSLAESARELSTAKTAAQSNKAGFMLVIKWVAGSLKLIWQGVTAGMAKTAKR
jgi:hypothetical protein